MTSCGTAGLGERGVQSAWLAMMKDMYEKAWHGVKEVKYASKRHDNNYGLPPFKIILRSWYAELNSK